MKSIIWQKHGLTKNGIKHPIYKLRDRMIRDCHKIAETHPSYPTYRGKGIKVCEEWQNDVMIFYKWCMENGWEKGLTIDRIDSKGHYQPDNCRFISRSENSIKARYENNQKGSNGPNSKLTDEKVTAIKLLLKLGFNIRKIAAFFEVGKTTIVSINMGYTWKNIEEI